MLKIWQEIFVKNPTFNTYGNETIPAGHFLFNDTTNKKILNKIRCLPDKREALKLFSHLISSQYKWMARILNTHAALEMSWRDPLYDLDELENQWEKSLKPWTDFIKNKADKQLATEVTFAGFDNGHWAPTPQDIALQLNYHSIHHRVQMQTIIREQGLEPDFIDYIGTKYRNLGER